MAVEKEMMLNEMDQARACLNASMEKITPQDDIYPTWKLKQVMDHITGWDELVAEAFRSHSQGEKPALAVKRGINQFNAQSVAAREAMSLEQSKQAYIEARVKVIQALKEMPDDQLTVQFPAPWGGMCSVASVVKIFVSHELEHAKQIEEYLAQASQSG